MADAKISALTSLSVPALDEVLAAVDVSGSPDSVKLLLNYLLAMDGSVPGGRLTLTTGVPVTTSDVTAAGTLYYAPYIHNRIRIYDGTRWRLYNFSELSLSLTLTSGKPYDIFVYDNSGTLTLEALVWTNDTTRATAITKQDGVDVKTGATTRLFLGTIYASGTNTTEDSKLKRFVSNRYNRVLRTAFVTDATVSWNYSTATYRQKNAAAANQFDAVFCEANILVDLADVACVTSSAGSITVANGIGVSSTSSNSAQLRGFNVFSSTLGISQTIATYKGYPGTGRFYFAELEWSTATPTTTWYGTVSEIVTGLTGSLMA